MPGLGFTIFKPIYEAKKVNQSGYLTSLGFYLEYLTIWGKEGRINPALTVAIAIVPS
ncbi:MAG: hypothetical protein F6K50_52250 [Moorea sp. SIO3I7]|nr:hypothetical protein [Moorena sp. SIO3I7]